MLTGPNQGKATIVWFGTATRALGIADEQSLDFNRRSQTVIDDRAVSGGLPHPPGQMEQQA